MDDLISRQAAIDMLKNRWKKTRNYEGIGDDIAEECELYLKQVPSAQPEHVADISKKVEGDCISRQAAIDAINKAFERVFAWDGTSPLGDKVLENVPSAQPEQRWIPFKTRPLTKAEKDERIRTGTGRSDHHRVPSPQMDHRDLI